MQVMVQLSRLPRTGVPAQGSVPKTAGPALTCHPDPVPSVEGSGSSRMAPSCFPTFPGALLTIFSVW